MSFLDDAYEGNVNEVKTRKGEGGPTVKVLTS